jgi:hypothetical protein
MRRYRFRFRHAMAKLIALPARPLRERDARRNLVEPRERLVDFFAAGSQQSEPLTPVG